MSKELKNLGQQWADEILDELKKRRRRITQSLATLKNAGDYADAHTTALDLIERMLNAATPSSANGAEGLPEDALNSQYFGKLLSRLVEFGFEGGHDENLIEWIRAYARAAVLAEREAAARICETHIDPTREASTSAYAMWHAKQIRARK